MIARRASESSEFKMTMAFLCEPRVWCETFSVIPDPDPESRCFFWSLGNPGDFKPVGEGVSEMRIDYGPGYRVYFVRRGQTIVVLLAGGDKHTQDRDIKTALALAREL